KLFNCLMRGLSAVGAAVKGANCLGAWLRWSPVIAFVATTLSATGAVIGLVLAGSCFDLIFKTILH
ncbi:hypothetical protein ABTM02_19940, partial [Acinetobacter baumannii]